MKKKHLTEGQRYEISAYLQDGKSQKEIARILGFNRSDRFISVGPGSNSQSISYEPNGNISSKLGIGAYTYDAYDKPHAVRSVDNDYGWIPDSGQVITYNAFGKVSHVTSTKGSDTYTYDITYGPDRQRWFSVLEKNGSLVRHTEYHDGYDIVYKDGVGTYYYYINGADGLAVVYTVNTQNGEKGYYVEKDHLGTIRALYDYAGNLAFAANYDPWGKRSLVNNALYIPFYRGFTGHEHIDELGLIDMNGRMYDPLIGRFLSPDPFIQMPDNSQSFNRYSYCINNPLKYTDPDGNWFLETIFTYTVDFIATAFFKGGLDITSKSSRREAWKNFDPTASWSKTNKAFKIDWGGLRKEFVEWGHWQKGATPYEYFKEFNSKLFNTEFIQSKIGEAFAHYQNLDGNVEKVGYYEDRTIIRVKDDAFDGYSGVSWGHYVFGENIAMNPGDVGHNVDLFAHEFGHTYQSRIAGPLYLSKYGLPSAIYQDKAEKDANYRAFKNFGIQPYGDPMEVNRIKWFEDMFSPVLFRFMWTWN